MKKKRFLTNPLAALFVLGLIVCDRSGIALMTVFAAIVHECGHLFMAKVLQIPLKSMRLDFSGARIDVIGGNISYAKEWLLAAGGPFTSFVCSAAAAVFWKWHPYAVLFSCASLILGLLNLLPIRSFDGGRMMESFLMSHFSPRTSHAVLSMASFLSLFLVWAFSVYFLLLAGNGLSLLFFSMSLLVRFADHENL